MYSVFPILHVRDFFELCVIATLNLTIIIMINVTSEYRTQFAIWVERCLIILTVLLVLCAMTKLYLYISAYDALTYLRMYAAWFLCLLLGVFLLLLFRKRWYATYPVDYTLCDGSLSHIESYKCTTLGKQQL